VVPFTSPIAIELVAFVVVLNTAGLETTLYEVIASPPSEAGGVHDTVAVALPLVASTLVGAPGTVAGVTEGEALEVAETPIPFVALTVNVYAVPLVSPVASVDVAEVVPAKATGLETIV
jgi:hypothetical protein